MAIAVELLSLGQAGLGKVCVGPKWVVVKTDQLALFSRSLSSDGVLNASIAMEIG